MTEMSVSRMNPGLVLTEQEFPCPKDLAARPRGGLVPPSPRPEPSHAVTGAWRLLRKAAEMVEPVRIMPTEAELQALVDELYA